MKKFKAVAILLALCLLLTCVLAGCHDKQRPELAKYNVPYDALIADSYKDYAAEVQLNVDDYPELSRQGLRLVTGYGEDYSFANEGMPNDDEVIRSSFDPDLGILVIINGLQLGIGRSKVVNMQSDSRLLEKEYFEDSTDIAYFADDPNSDQIYDLGKYWRDDNGYKSYNVFYFHWEMFADHYEKGGLMDTINAPFVIQEKVWSTDGGVQAAYNRNGKTYATEPGEAVNGSLAEWFAAEYMRMAQAVSRVYPNYGQTQHDVRFAGHSMGGTLTVASAALLNLLGDADMLQSGFVPNRLALMDSYLGDSSKTDYTIAWTGNKYIHPENSERCCNYIAALDMLVNKFGVAAEFICNEGFTVPFLCVEGITDTYYVDDLQGFDGANAELANKILELCPIVVVRPYFAAVSGFVAFDGHNPVREWYLSSILYAAPTVQGKTVPTARMSDSDVRALRGQYFVMVNERQTACETVRCDDDVFTLNRTERVEQTEQ